jgi:hypothetical protein
MMFSTQRIRDALAARMSTATSAQLTAPYLRLVLWLMVGLLWVPVFAMAAPAVGAEPDMVLMISPLLLAVTMFVSTLAGVTALLTRIDRELSSAPDKPLPHPWIFCATHMTGSWVAGTLCFFGAQDASMSVWKGLGMVVVGSFAGAKLLELAAERMLGKTSAASPAIPPNTSP